MAVTGPRSIRPKVPKPEDLEGADILLDYDRPTDTLSVSFGGPPRPAVSVYVDDDTIYRINPMTQHVVGLEIEAFLGRPLDWQGREARA